MSADTLVQLLLFISALGIYIHAFFLTISLGFPWIIMALMYKWWRTEDRDYYDATRTATAVLGLNFALGAITGTLVEFGLVQAWPGSIFVIATFGFVPLIIELVAFVGEIVLLIMFIVTLGRSRPAFSLGIMALYAIMAILSGAVITTVNSWLNVPWGTANLASTLYPFLPQYGPNVVNVEALVRLKVELLRSLVTSGSSSQIIQDPTVASTVGVTLQDPFVAFDSPYALASMLHNVNAGIIIGMSFGLVGFAYRYLRTGAVKHVKIIRAFLPLLLILLVVQPTVLGDSMGKMVAANQPTKFALMEAAQTAKFNPLVSFLAYNDPNQPITGFDSFRAACESNRGKTLGELVSQVSPDLDTGPLSSVALTDLCLSDLDKAETRMTVVNAAYYSKLTMGIVALVSLIALTAYVFNARILSKLAARILGRFLRKRVVFALSLLMLIGSVSAGMLGWFVRDGGRKPWTVYGLLYPTEVVTTVPIDPLILAIFTLTFVLMAIVGVYGIYIVATRRLRFIELLKKGAGIE